MTYVTFEDVADCIDALPRAGLIAIDGLPVSGKSTLAERLSRRFGLETVYLDDFVLPERLWPSDRTPAFPFRYIRYGEFLAVVEALGTIGEATYFPFDWAMREVSTIPRTLRLETPIVVEGVSSLHPDLEHHYALRLYVQSDRRSTLQAAVARGVGDWLSEWRDWFLPSADLYFATDPASRADILLAGRNAPNAGQSPLE
jgi:uridine kinase